MKLLIPFIMMFTGIFGQSRLHTISETGQPMTTIFPSNPMTFVTMSGDSVFVSILADSIDAGKRDYMVYAYFQEIDITKNYSLTIVLDDAESVVLQPTYSDWEDSYFEYKISDSDRKKLTSSMFQGLLFESGRDIISCVTLKRRDFFSDFLKQN